jgi:Zn-dependent protease
MIQLDPIGLVAIAVGLLVGITVHEFSHCLVAYWLGDPTGKRMGRLTLNPLVHLDPLGTLMIVITALTGFGIGWGKPAPVSPWNLRPGRRLGMGLVAAGGPAANLLVALFTALVVRLLFAMQLGVPTLVVYILYGIIGLNLSLAAFNLLPLPMLDGFHILMGIVDSIRARWAQDLGYQLERIEPHGPMIPVYRLLNSLVGLVLSL